MTKSVGVAVMHEVFEYALEVLRSCPASLKNPEYYRDLMEKPLQNLSGDNQNSETVHGENFWMSGKEGVAGQYTSEASKRTLKLRIIREIQQFPEGKLRVN
jgi:hypothetical protein